MEKDLDTRLDWAAVDHWNTSHPHTPVVVRGKEEPLIGRVVARGLTDMLKDRYSLIVDGVDGRTRYVEIGEPDREQPTRDGTVVVVSPRASGGRTARPLRTPAITKAVQPRPSPAARYVCIEAVHRGTCPTPEGSALMTSHASSPAGNVAVRLQNSEADLHYCALWGIH